MKNIVLSIFTILLLQACSSTENTTTSSKNTSDELIKGRHPKENAVLWHQTAAEYDALCYQAFNAAKNWINNNVTDDAPANSKPRAIVMDLDETVLDNSKYNASRVMRGLGYDKKSWIDWTSRIKAEMVPGADEFIDFVRGYGIKILFISNRTVEETSQTLDNLNSLGINVEQSDLFLKRGDNNKAERRLSVSNDYEVIMFVGDNLADFNNMYEQNLTVTERSNYTNEIREEFGKKYIILPNAMYGGWESVLKNDDPSYETNKKFKDRRRYIRGF